MHLWISGCLPVALIPRRCQTFPYHPLNHLGGASLIDIHNLVPPVLLPPPEIA
jgi:hypothetical protein